jgi:hypothetical protein
MGHATRLVLVQATTAAATKRCCVRHDGRRQAHSSLPERFLSCIGPCPHNAAAAPTLEVYSALSQLASTNRSPLIVGVSGHRDLHASCIDRATREVIAFFDQLAALVPNTPIRVMVGMAAGADMLVASAALERDLAVDAVLPMPLEEYSNDFSPALLTELRRLL